MRGLSLHSLAWAAAVLPFATIHISYLIAAAGGHVEWCIPYWDSCTSISAAGRQLPEKIWFKLGMFPAALVTGLLWWCLWRWLQQTAAGRLRVTGHSMLILGVLASGFLMLYTAALGEEGDSYQRLRRIGITLTFTFTFMAQLLCTRILGRLNPDNDPGPLRIWHKRLVRLLSVLLLVGLGSVILDAWLGQGYDAMEDAVEWALALLLNAWFACLALVLARIPVTLDITSKINN